MDIPIEDMVEQPSIVGYADSDVGVSVVVSKPAVVSKPVKPVKQVYFNLTVEHIRKSTTRELKMYRASYKKGYTTIREMLGAYPRTVIWVNGEVMPMSYKIQQGDFVVRRHC